MPLNKVIRPAIKLAEEGFIVNDALADDLKTYGSEVIRSMKIVKRSSGRTASR